MAISKGSWRVKIISAKGKDYRIEDGEGNVIVYGSGHITDNAPDNAQAIAALPELVEVLQSIEQYGSDTLSGNAQGPNDASWYRDGVREMRNRARDLLARLEGL